MKKHYRWKELDPFIRCLIIVLGSLQITLLIAALADIRSRPAYLIRGRKVWWILGSFIDIIGPLSYFVCGRKRNLEFRKDFL